MIGGAKGIGIGIDFGIPNQYCRATSKTYIEKDVLDSLRVVASAYGKSNNDADRSIVKNLVDASNPFIISNAAFKLNSGFGEYAADFLDWTSPKDAQKTSFEVKITSSNYKENWVAYKAPNTIFKAMKVRISGIPDGGSLQFFRTTADGGGIKMVNGINEIPEFTNTVAAGFYIDIPLGFDWSNLVIEQIPSFQGAFVTDGIDDLITSTKTVQEMGITDEVTVVSMIHQIALNPTYNVGTTNYLENLDNGKHIRSDVYYAGKTGIYGYTASLINNTASDIKNILGDKADYSTQKNEPSQTLHNSKFSVVGRARNLTEPSSVAWYWTVIANKVLTTDQINQVIAYYDLDKYLEPTVLYNVKRQGLSNDTPASEWYLKDYSKNGYDMTLNNFSKAGGSGIAAKQGESIKDYSIIKDEEYQELTIYNEFKFKIKSKLSGRYWTVQYINRTNTSYPVTIVIDKDAYWVNSTTYYDADNNKQVIRKDIPIAADTPIDVLCCGYDQFDIPEDATSIVSAVSYINYNAVGEITVELIPSCEGGLITDGVNDFGKVTGLPAYKDYTTIIDYQRFDIGYIEGKGTTGILSKAHAAGQGAFLMNLIGSTGTHMNSYSFGTANANTYTDLDRQIYYQTKYKMQGFDMTAGTGVDGDSMWLALVRDNDSRFFNGAIYSLMTFPYSMSEFLIERQLKKHKLGTLYPDMVEFRPIVKSNSEYQVVDYYIDTFPAVVGNYYPINSKLRIAVTTKGEADEVTSLTVNGVSLGTPSVNGNRFTFNGTLSDKSPQKTNITIDEYIRFEDIVQPYPLFFEFTDENNNLISWGGKAKVGSTITRTKGVNYANLLEGLFTITNPRLNGVPLSSSQHVVEKSMVFTCTATWAFDNNKPKSILSPRLLRIPNSSYKILGYIPDISGHNNNGIIHNSAYAEGSGVNEDGSYQFDGVDDFVAIPTLSSGGKQVLMKANWQSNIGDAILYDQRFNVYNYEFAIYNSNTDNYSENPHAYSSRNNGKTYIDGILNTYIKSAELQNVTHNIIATNELSSGSIPLSPIIGSNISHDSAFAQMSLYDFMLFDDISTEDKIKELNEYVGIEAKVELPPYYWDTYGKTNFDADRDTIQQRGIAVGDYDLINYNHAYEGMSGYNGYPIILSGTNRTYQDKASYVNVVGDDKNVINLTRISFNTAAIFSYVKQNGELTSYNKDIESFKIKVTGIDYSRFVIKYSYISEANATTKTTMTIASDSIYELPKSFASDGSLTSSDIWIGINFTKQSADIPDIIEDVNVTIEVLPEYENGLVYDGVEDFSDNKNVPIIDDFTVIAKRTWLEENISDKPFIIKGDTLYPDGNQNAFLFEYGKLSTYSFGQNNKYDESVVPSLISWATPTSYNGTTSLVRGSAIDTVGIDIAHATKMVLYKLILYPKTISLLEINFLKNLMEKDEIIDLTNPIFIQ